MERITLPGIPANASAYLLDDGRIYRVHLDLKTPEDKLSTADYVEIETRGYEVDESGALILDGNGEPKLIKAQRARIPLANVRNGTDSVKPGWVMVPEAPRAEGEEVPEDDVSELPTTANEGDVLRFGGIVYRYTLGLYEACRRMRLTEVPPVVAALDAATLASLRP